MIRAAVETDIPAIVEMVGAYRHEVRPDLKFHAGIVGQVAARLIGHARGCAFLLERGGPQGLLLGCAAPAIWWPELVAEMQMLWIRPAARGGDGARRLLARFEEWAVSIGASKIGVTWTGKDATAFYTRAGYRPAETRMLKDLG